jgi:thiamine-phosphate pyrophosphorylase
MRENNITVPIVAIGGICKEDIPSLLDCGIDGIALSGSVLNAANPIDEMQEITKIINKQ